MASAFAFCRGLRSASLVLTSWLATTAAYCQGAVVSTNLEVEITSNTDCGNSGQLQREIVKLAPTAEQEDLRVALRIEERDGIYRAELSLSKALEGRRRLRAATCESIVSAAALIAAIAVDPNAAFVSEPETTPGPETIPEPETVPVPEAIAEPSRSPTQPDISSKNRWQFSVLAGAMLRGATLPRYSVGPSLALGLRTGRVSLSITGAHFFDADQGVQSVDREVIARVRSSLLALDTCAAPWPLPIEVALCGGLQLEALGATTTETQYALPKTLWLPSATAGLRLRYPSDGAFSIVVAPSAEFPLLRPLPSLAVQNAGSVYDVQALGFRGMLMLRWDP